MKKSEAVKNGLIASEDSNEIFNSVSHMAGFLLAVAGTAVLVVLSAMQQKWIHLISFSIYGLAMILVFVFSSILHSFMIFGKYFKVFGIQDHSAIYLLIAGTYTPFCLALIGGALGWTIFGIIWGLAVVNLVLKAVFFERMGNAFSMAGYIIMGWISILMVQQLIAASGWPVLMVILAGGLFYTIGAIVFYFNKPNPFPPVFGSHEIGMLRLFLGMRLFSLRCFFMFSEKE